MTYKIIQHDCEVDTHDFSTIGPFEDRTSAEVFIDEYDLETPTDGGYAFAVVVLAEPGDSFGESPEEYVEFADEIARVKGTT